MGYEKKGTKTKQVTMNQAAPNRPGVSAKEVRFPWLRGNSRSVVPMVLKAQVRTVLVCVPRVARATNARIAVVRSP
jgi:hypothetical protein